MRIDKTGMKKPTSRDETEIDRDEIEQAEKMRRRGRMCEKSGVTMTKV